MNTINENVPELTYQVGNLVNEVIEKLRPLLTNIVKEVMMENSELPPETPAVENKVADFAKFENTVNELGNNVKLQLDTIENLLKEFAHKEQINKELHEELQKYRAGLRREILMPLLKNIMKWQSKIVDMQTYYGEKAKETESDNADLFSKLLNEYKNLSFGLLDLLYDYDIEPFEPKEGEEYQPKIHKSIHNFLVDDASKDHTIASCQGAGFIDVTSGRMLKQAEVTVYKYNVTSTDNIN
jgi:molecular chaperone GrpE (heat shock protein)